jgi:predicted esterase
MNTRGCRAFSCDRASRRRRNLSLEVVPIFHGHGSFDRVIPADLVTRSESYLRDSSGAAMEMKRYPIAQEMSELEVRDINEWLLQR